MSATTVNGRMDTTSSPIYRGKSVDRLDAVLAVATAAAAVKYKKAQLTQRERATAVHV